MRDDKFYKIGAGILVFLIVLIITFMVIGKKSGSKISKVEEEAPASVSSSNVIENTSAIDNLNELEEITSTTNQNNVTNDTNKKDSSISNQSTEYMNKEQNNKNTAANNIQSTSTKNTSNESDEQEQNTVKSEEDDELVFKYPVEGEIVREYAKDKLVYSNTLGEWVTHPGIDIKADKTTVVKSSAAGTVKSIKNDPRYGLTVVVEHIKGYCTVYSNLLTAEFVSVGENISSGQTIGTVGNTASFEILDEPHLHFEIIKDGEQIDPIMYLKN